MPSMQCRIIRFVLNVRKVFFDWNAPIGRLRERVDRNARTFKPPRDVTLLPIVADVIPCEWLVPHDAPPRPVIFYLHGGGWTLGWTNIHRTMVAHLCQAVPARALAV